MRNVDWGRVLSEGISADRVTPLSSTRGMSCTSSIGEDGVGDSTTEGIRPWPRRFGGFGLSDLLSTGEPVSSCMEGEGVFVGSQSTPGLTIKLTVSPSFTLYSFSSLESARALPLSRRRCASAGGAWGCAASRVFMEEMESAGETGMAIENGGLRDLNVTWMVAVQKGI